MNVHEKKVLVFDLDGTLTPSKSAIPDAMADVFTRTLEAYEVCVISGGSFLRFERQLLANVPAHAKLESLILMPTCGTQCYRYEKNNAKWSLDYIDALADEDKQHIIDVLQEAIGHFGYDNEVSYGALIEDRDSQVTYSALGQDIAEVLGEEGLRLKTAWDVDGSKKQRLRDYVAERLPDFEVRISSPTSIDVSNKGRDKAYGVQKLMELLQAEKYDLLFIGDRLQPGGNDYPVKQLGIDCIAVSSWEETATLLKDMLGHQET